MRREPCDVLIIGGGINGAGIARDLALRARNAGAKLRIALIEQHHFASGTSGKNSQLIHGGLRYLKQLEFGLVREALQERTTLLEIAPHLVEPLPFLIPFHGSAQRAYYGVGLWLYSLLAGRQGVGRRRSVSRAELERLEPGFAIDGVSSAGIYYDCKVHAARLVLENIFDAVAHGAMAANYTRYDQLAREDSTYRVALTDTLSGETFEIRARKLVVTTGPWQRTAKLRLVRGSHLVLPRLNNSENAVAHFGGDGRIFFVIPWGSRNDLSLVGTTDVDHHTGADDVRISGDEIRYMMKIVGQLFPGSADCTPISAFSSLRPLVESGEASATKTSREHRIWNSGSGVLHVAGGKYTTYRAMAEEATNLLAEELFPDLIDRCSTATQPVGGNSAAKLEALRESCAELAERFRLETGEVEYLSRDFGVLAPAVLDLAPETPQNGLSRLDSALIAYTVKHEMVCRLADLLFVSTYRGYEERKSDDGLLAFARELGRHLSWPEESVRREMDLARSIAAVPDTP